MPEQDENYSYFSSGLKWITLAIIGGLIAGFLGYRTNPNDYCSHHCSNSRNGMLCDFYECSPQPPVPPDLRTPFSSHDLAEPFPMIPTFSKRMLWHQEHHGLTDAWGEKEPTSDVGIRVKKVVYETEQSDYQPLADSINDIIDSEMVISGKKFLDKCKSTNDDTIEQNVPTSHDADLSEAGEFEKLIDTTILINLEHQQEVLPLTKRPYLHIYCTEKFQRDGILSVLIETETFCLQLGSSGHWLSRQSINYDIRVNSQWAIGRKFEQSDPTLARYIQDQCKDSFGGGVWFFTDNGIVCLSRNGAVEPDGKYVPITEIDYQSLRSQVSNDFLRVRFDRWKPPVHGSRTDSPYSSQGGGKEEP